MTIGLRSRVGPYEVTALLGEGGMGKVWRARHHALHRDDALKVLPEIFAADLGIGCEAARTHPNRDAATGWW